VGALRFVIATPTFPTDLYLPERFLAMGLRDLGYGVTVLTTDQAVRTSVGSAVRSTEADGIEIIRLHAWKPYREPLLARGLLNPTRPEKWDFGIIAEDWRPLSRAFGTAFRLWGISFEVTSERAGYFAGPIRSVLHKLGDRTGNADLWDDSVAVTCHSTASVEFHRRIGVPESKLAYIPACVDTRLFRPPERPPPPTGPVRILSVGRFEPQKGQEPLLRAFAGIKGAELTLKGRGPLYERLRAVANELGLGSRVVFDGSVVPEEELPAYYGRFDIYVQPSLDEPFGMAAVEAMACGLPVVATDAGGLADSVIPGVSGFRVPLKDGAVDVGEFSRRLGDLVHYGVEQRHIGAAARWLAVEKFDSRVVAARHVEIARKGGI